MRLVSSSTELHERVCKRLYLYNNDKLHRKAEDHKKRAVDLFVRCTKADVTLNNLIVRGRSLDCIGTSTVGTADNS